MGRVSEVRDAISAARAAERRIHEQAAHAWRTDTETPPALRYELDTEFSEARDHVRDTLLAALRPGRYRRPPTARDAARWRNAQHDADVARGLAPADHRSADHCSADHRRGTGCGVGLGCGDVAQDPAGDGDPRGEVVDEAAAGRVPVAAGGLWFGPDPDAAGGIRVLTEAELLAVRPDLRPHVGPLPDTDTAGPRGEDRGADVADDGWAACRKVPPLDRGAWLQDRLDAADRGQEPESRITMVERYEQALARDDLQAARSWRAALGDRADDRADSDGDGW